MLVEARNTMHHNIFGLNLRCMCMRFWPWLQSQIMRKQNTFLSTFVNRDSDAGHKHCSDGTKYPFHRNNMGTEMPFFKLGGLPC